MGAHRGLLTAVAVTAGLMALAGCTDDPEPIVTTTPTSSASVPESPSPSATASSSATPSPSATALTDEEVLALVPEDARDESLAGAANFSYYFLELYPQMFVANPGIAISTFDALSSPDCDFCSSSIDSALRTADMGAHSTGGSLTFDRAAVPKGGVQDDGDWVIEFPLSAEPSTTVNSEGAQIASSDGGTGTATIGLAYVDGAWQVLGVRVEFGDDS